LVLEPPSNPHPPEIRAATIKKANGRSRADVKAGSLRGFPLLKEKILDMLINNLLLENRASIRTVPETLRKYHTAPDATNLKIPASGFARSAWISDTFGTL
jgi:hypothetical protein